MKLMITLITLITLREDTTTGSPPISELMTALWYGKQLRAYLDFSLRIRSPVDGSNLPIVFVASAVEASPTYQPESAEASK